MSSKTAFPRWILNLGDETGTYSSIVTKRKIMAQATVLSDKVDKFEGTFIIKYTKDLYNEFDFTDLKDFERKVIPCIEKELLNDFK